MKKFGLILPIVLASCVSHEIKQVKPNEIGLNDSFANRVFTISCEGSEFHEKSEVNDKCKEYASKFAFEKGYSYFSVLDHSGSFNTNINSYTTHTPVTSYSAYGYGSSTSYVPKTNIYSETIHTKDYTFVLIDSSDIKNWNNYYKVSDYYTQQQIESEK